MIGLKKIVQRRVALFKKNTMKKYPKYKDSGVEWLITIPFDWELKKLKFKANIQFSNVDKLSDDSEIPVLLCNYVDVYKNERIHNELQFMQATANNSEIKKFKLKKGDVIITKDSESVDDIAVPALVIDDFENVLCGYHLAQIKVQKDITGEFLFRLFQSKDFNQNFESSANGMTRYGLSVSTIKNVIIPIPPLPEQLSIVQFLDHKTDRIDRFIANRQKQIELLKEQKTAIINKAVTKGINPNAKMKNSGIEWIGEVPEHWEIIKLKFCLKSMVGGGTPSKDNPEYWNGDIPWVSPKDMKSDFIEKSEDNITEKGLKESSTNLIKEPSILIVVRSGILKHTLPVAINTVQVTLNQDLKALVPNKRFSIEYFFELFRGVAKIILFNCTKVVATVDSIETNDLMKFLMPVPSIDEQNEILVYIKSETSTIDTLISKYQKQIDLMLEYRTALISQAVTGKICLHQDLQD